MDVNENSVRTFGEHKTTRSTVSKLSSYDPTYEQWKITFPNGYGASIIRGAHTYGGQHRLFELAVLLGGHLCYTTPITDDVIGHLTETEVGAILDKIEQLKGAV